MASRPPVECPLCHAELERDDDIETHLLQFHSKHELARYVVSDVELAIEGDVSD